MLNVLLLILASLLIFPGKSTVQMDEKKVALFSGNTVVAAAKSDQESPKKRDSEEKSIKEVEDYEKEKPTKNEFTRIIF